MPRAAAEPSRWSPDRANRWYQAQGWLVGANYITSNAINQLEMFQADTFDPRRIDTELGWAQLHGLNTVRVFLHDQLWAQDQRGFQSRLAQFVGIAARHRIKPSSSCSTLVGIRSPSRDGSGPRSLGSTTRVGCKAQAQNTSMTSTTVALCATSTGVLTQFRTDDRVLGWDLWNEPDNPAREYRKVERKDKLRARRGPAPPGVRLGTSG